MQGSFAREGLPQRDRLLDVDRIGPKILKRLQSIINPTTVLTAENRAKLLAPFAEELRDECAKRAGGCGAGFNRC